MKQFYASAIAPCAIATLFAAVMFLPATADVTSINNSARTVVAGVNRMRVDDSSGTVTLVPGLAGSRIQVWGATLTLDALTTMEFTGATTTQNADWTGATTAVTLTATNAAIAVGQTVTGPNIANGTAVSAISGTALTLNQNTLGSASGVILVFSNSLTAPLATSAIQIDTPTGQIGVAGTVPWLETATGDPLILRLGTSARVTGQIVYTQLP